MRRQFSIILLIVTFCVAMVGVVRAATAPPNIVSYQGRLLDASGVPVTSASASIVFRLYNASSGGTCLWSNSSSTCASATARTVTLTSGLFSENLGDTGVSYAAIPDSVFANNAAVYLGVMIGSDSEMTPRKRVTAAPYALNAQTIDGIDSTSLVRNGATENFDLSSAKFLGASPFVFEGGTVNANNLTLAVTDPTGIRTQTLQDGSGVVPLGTAGNTLLFTTTAGTSVTLPTSGTLVGSADTGSVTSTMILDGTIANADISSVAAIAYSKLNITDGDLTIAKTSGLQSALNGKFSTSGGSLSGDVNVTGKVAVASGTAVSPSFTFTGDTNTGIYNPSADSVGITGGGSDLLTISSTGLTYLNANKFNVNSLGFLTIGDGQGVDIPSGGTQGISFGYTSATLINIGSIAATSINIGNTNVGDTSISRSVRIADASGTHTINLGGVGFNGADTIRIATEGTSADTVTIGNSNASTTVAITGGDDWSIAATGAAAFKTTTLTQADALTTPLTISGAVSGTANELAISTKNVSGNLINLSYPSAVSLAGNLIGENIDFSAATNVTQNVTGVSVTTPATTGLTDTKKIVGYQIESPGAVTSVIGTSAWSGFSASTPSITQTGGTLSASDFYAKLNPASITTGGTLNGLDVFSSGIASGVGTINGVNIENISDGTATSTNALTIGSGWDTSLYFNSTAPVITMSNTAILTWKDSVSNTLLTLTDAGTTGNLSASGNIFVGVGGLFDASAAGALNVGTTNATSINIGSVATALNLNDSTTNATINIGDVVSNAQDTINIATNGTLLDTINIGNTASGTIVGISGGTVNLGNTASTKTVNIGGVSTDGSDNIAISTNSTSADTISIGNTNAGTTTSITGGSLQLGAGGASAVGIVLGNPNASSSTHIYGGPSWEITTSGTIFMGANLESTTPTIHLFDDALTADATIDIGSVGTDAASTVNIATNGTTADAITIGNTNTLTTLGLKGGVVTLTGGATTGATTSSAFVLSDTSLTTGTLLYGDMRGTSGTGVNFAYGGAVTQSTAAFTGLAVDLTNLTGANGLDMTNVALTTKGQTRSGAGTETISGLTIASSASLTQNTAAGTFNWTGIGITSPTATANFAGSLLKEVGYKSTLSAITGAAGNILSAGIQVTIPDSAIVTSGIMTALNIEGTGALGVITTGPAAGTLTGLRIPTISTPGAGIETAISIGSGWDTAIDINSGKFSVASTGIASLNLNGTATTNGLCHSGANVDVATDTTRNAVACSAAPADYAEWYETDGTPNQGDIVMMTSQMFTYNASESNAFTGEILPDKTQKSIPVLTKAASDDSTMFGVVSTSPNQTIGTDVRDQGAHPQPIALAGRVPVNVTNENGTIAPGDYVTISSTPGKGMKATLAGRVIGVALTGMDGVSGQVTVLVTNGWYLGSLIGKDGASNILTNQVIVAPVQKATSSATSFDSFGLALRGSAWNGNQAQTVSMMFQNKVTDGTNYRLSVRNTADSEVAYITNTGTMQVAGDMVVGGKIYPSNLGSVQTDKYIYYDGSAGPGGDFMRTNASGWSTGSYDFAEMFPSTDDLKPGDVVVFSDKNVNVKRSSGLDEKSIAGIVSTRPGFLAGENKAGDYPIALAGRVPTNVSNENGAIAVGDPLTTSSTPGVAMKATKPGSIVGYALEPFGGTSGQILVFVRAQYWGGDATSLTPGADNRASSFGASGNSSMTSLSMSGTINMNGNDLTNIGRMTGLTNAWSIELDGTIKTEALLKTVITGQNNQPVETIAVTSPEAVITLSGTVTLKDGQAEVRFADVNQDFGNVISAITPIHVVATPNGPVSLYVSEKDQNHFVVKSLNGNTSGIDVDWMVTAYRKGYEPKSATDPIVDQTSTTTTDTSAVKTTTPTVTSSDVSTPSAGSQSTSMTEPTTAEVKASDSVTTSSSPASDPVVAHVASVSPTPAPASSTRSSTTPVDSSVTTSGDSSSPTPP